MAACIWYICKYVAPPDAADGTGGVGGRGYELMRELAASGHECVIITSDANHLATVPDVGGSHLLEDRDGMLVCWLRTMKSARAKSFRRIGGWLHFEWQLARLSKRSLPAPDVVIVSSPSLLTVLSGVLIRRRRRVRLVFEVRDIWPLTLVDEGGYSPRHPAIRLLSAVERLGYRHAEAIVGTMPNLGRHVATVLGQEKPVHCIPMGYAPRALTRAPEVPSTFVETYLPKNKFTVAYAGTIGISNALDPFFAAAAAMSQREDIQFLVIGEGALLPQYQQRFRQLRNVTFVPKVAKEIVPGLLARCDLLYLSTRAAEVWQYGQSLNKLIDYMLAGKPILASFTGYPSMIDEADCGTYVPAGDVDALIREVVRYVEMPEHERLQIGARGRNWVLRHRSYPRLAREYAEVLLPLSAPPTAPRV